jgi:hypothetical protein
MFLKNLFNIGSWPARHRHAGLYHPQMNCPAARHGVAKIQYPVDRINSWTHLMAGTCSGFWILGTALPQQGANQAAIDA